MLMPLRRSKLATFLPTWFCHVLAVLLILGAGAGHIVYLLNNPPLDLAQDEAHYWDWSRHLDWSYYSKGPLVAYLIWASCALVGPWSESHTGNLMFAVRLPAVLCGTLLLTSLYLLTVQVFGRPRLALGVLAVALTLPLIAAGSSLMTIDSPYCCCWGWALVLGYQALRGSRWAWPLAGLVVGVGILAKYTMVLFVPSLGLFLLATPEYRRLLLRPGFWVLAVVGALCCFPIVMWNIQHDWVGLKHVIGLSGFLSQATTTEPKIHWLGPLVYLGSQCVLLLVYWFIAWAIAMIWANPLREADSGKRYLWWMSAPMFLCFLVFSLKNGGGELNWPVTAYLSGLVLAVAWLESRFVVARDTNKWIHVILLGWICLIGLTLGVVMHQSEWARPLLLWLAKPTEENPYRLRNLDPTCRLRGWRTLAAEIDRLRRDYRARGIELVLAGDNWSLPGEIGVYCEGHPQVYSIGLAVGDRHSQYDFWIGPVTQPEEFAGRSFLIVNAKEKDLRLAFKKVERLVPVYHNEGDVKISAWTIAIAHGFTRFPERQGTQRNY